MKSRSNWSAWAVLGLVWLMAFTACEEAPEPRPRPRGFPQMNLPEHSYRLFQPENCPFQFEAPAYAELARQGQDSCVIDFAFPQFDARWHITYRNIPASGRSLLEHREEHRSLVFKHIQKVSQIGEKEIQGPGGTGKFYELYGSVGTPAQLFISDSTHILMMAFYFDTAMENDSLAPAVDLLKADMQHVIKTIQFKD